MAATISRGVRAPIIREGDDIVQITVDSVLQACKEDNFQLDDKDVIAVTEAVVARAAGNYVTTDDVAADIANKFGGKAEGDKVIEKAEEVGIVFPIFSRNRFAICLRGIARGAKRVIVQMGYPTDEAGNHLIDEDTLDDSGVNPYSDILTADEFTNKFGDVKHEFTGVNYITYYADLIKDEGAEPEIILANRPEAIINYTTNVICADTHGRNRNARRIKKACEAAGKSCNVITLANVLSTPVKHSDGFESGFNAEYGLLGSNKATETTVKLFPNNAQVVAEGIAAKLSEATGKKIEAMVYGDGAFKDPVGKIWELADPVVSPGFTSGLKGLPNELKLKYLADNDFAGLEGEELQEAIRKAIREKEGDLKGNMASQGTTPRQITDLIGSLCDLTSGSGDKGTPIIVVQNYFKNYAM